MSILKERGVSDLLNKYKLRKTECRIRILECFQQFDFALSQGFLENYLKNDFDRVTIYRTLKSFLDNGLIHNIPDEEGGLKYALCPDECMGKVHRHGHAHFTCQICGETICLENISIPEVTIPDEFQANDIKLLVSGVCNKCR